MAGKKIDRELKVELPTREFFKNYADDSMAEVKSVLQKYLKHAESLLVQKFCNHFGVTEEQGDKLRLLPNNCRLLKAVGKKLLLLLETPPTVRTIKWDRRINAGHAMPNDLMGSPGDTFRLAFPYVIFLIVATENTANYTFNKIYIAYSKAPLSGDVKDMLYFPNLSNVGMNAVNNRHDFSASEKSGFLTGEGQLCVCMGGGGQFTAKTLPLLTQRAINFFWGAPFNCDLTHNMESAAYRDSRVKTVKAWADSTLSDPLFPLDVNWMPAIPVGEFISLVKSLYFADGVVNVVCRQVSTAVQKLFDQTWKDVLTSNMDNERIAAALHMQLKEVMGRFVEKISQDLSNLPKSKSRHHVEGVIVEALRKAVR